MRRLVLLLAGSTLLGLALLPNQVDAVPYFARQYEVECGMCHISPPKLNQFGEDFLARGFRMPRVVPTRRTWPFAVWATGRSHSDLSHDRARALPNRVEIISGGGVGKTGAFYFVEWLPVSQEVDGAGRRVARHGRFEDVFISIPTGPVDVVVGQYRMLSQVDVSRRLSISEPVAFAAGLAGQPALSSRLTALRSFSLSGRSPAVRVMHHLQREGQRAANGLYSSVTVPMAGEFVIPLTARVRRERNFEFELRPKGVLLESFYRHGLSTLGAHTFLGDERRQVGAVGVYNRGPFFSTLALGHAREITGRTETRVSWENEYIPRDWFSLGLRLDDRTGPNRPLAVIPFGNLQFPLTQYTLRIAAEFQQQRDNRRFLLEAGVVF
jgi:hypothetical protein